MRFTAFSTKMVISGIRFASTAYISVRVISKTGYELSPMPNKGPINVPIQNHGAARINPNSRRMMKGVFPFQFFIDMRPPTQNVAYYNKYRYFQFDRVVLQ